MAKADRPLGIHISRILYHHYLWCKKEGRDTNWYNKPKIKKSKKEK